MTENTSSKKKNIAAAAAAVAVAAALIAGGTYSYYTSEAQAVENTFEDNDVDIEITETDEEYTIIPGTSQDKDPTVTVSTTVDAFVYLIVSDTTDGLVEYEIDEIWSELYTADADGTTISVYYTTVSAAVDEDGSAVDQALNVLVGQRVWYSTEITTDSYDDSDEITLTFQSYAVQADPFTDLSDDEAAAAAYAFADLFDSDSMSYLAEYYTVVYSINELSEALNGDAIIILGSDIETSLDIEITSDTVIYGNGYTIKESGNTAYANVFKITADADLTLYNLTIDGTEAYTNSSFTSKAIYVDTKTTANITLVDCLIDMANDTYYTHGIYYSENTGGTLTVSNSRITAYSCICIYGDGVEVLVDSSKLTYENEFEDSDFGGWITVCNEEDGDTGTTPYSTYGGAANVSIEAADTDFITCSTNAEAGGPELDENDDEFGPIMFFNNTDTTCSAEVSGCTWDSAEYTYSLAAE